jgi:hypothetical protein
MSLHVESIGTCYLILNSGFVLKLEKTFYVSSFSRNLISVSRLLPFEYFFNFSDLSFSLFYKSNCAGNSIFFMVLSALIYKTMALMMQCMFTLALKNVLLMKIPLNYGTSD